MKSRVITALVACGILIALAQFLGALGSFVTTVACAMLAALLFFGLMAFFQIHLERWWAPAVCVTMSSFAGTITGSLGKPQRVPWAWLLAPAIAGATAAVVALVAKKASRRCTLCKRRLGWGVSFECPRCGMVVCDGECWEFEHLRCRLCEENRVTIFSPGEYWWTKQLGERKPYGKCQLCGGKAEERDLRACVKCGRAQCTECWDYANGECRRCHWVVADLPPQLKALMAPS
jgi:hypothetical protein